MNGIIDFHTHIFPDKIASKTVSFLAAKGNIKAYADGTESGLISAMEKADVSVAVALPAITKPSQFESVNAFAESINEKYLDKDRKIISFGGIHPQCEDIEGKLRSLKERGFKGIKLHPDYQGTYIDAPEYIRILECAKEYDLIVLTHAGYDNGFPNEPVKCPPELLKKVLKQVKYEKIVLAHYGGHVMWQQVYEMITDFGVYFDTAYTLCEIEREMFLKILERVGDDRVLFATDSPWRDIKEEADILRSYGISEKSERKIFRDNAVKLLNI